MDQTDAGHAQRFAETRSSDEAIAALRDGIGTGAEVYAVDHASDSLNRYGDGHSVPLDGRLRHEVFALRTSSFDGRWWIPVPERDQPVFVVSVPHPPDALGLGPKALGLLMAPLRQRFERLERGRRRAEMSVAAELQWDLLPVRADHGCGSSIAAVLEPAYDVAGDLFDHAFDESMWLYSFDGMGHGLGATTQGAAAVAAVRNRRRQGDGLAGQFAAASRTVHQLSGGDSFVTGVGCNVSAAGGVRIVNAGHEPVRTVSRGRVTALDLDVDLPLGVAADTRYRESSIVPLADGDGLVVMSDGAAGARTAIGEQLGRERLDEIVAAAWTDVPLQTAQDIASAVLDESVDELADDVTILVLRRDVAAAPPSGTNR